MPHIYLCCLMLCLSKIYEQRLCYTGIAYTVVDTNGNYGNRIVLPVIIIMHYYGYSVEMLKSFHAEFEPVSENNKH